MRKDVIEVIDQSPDLNYFLRTHPIWYKELARNPERINEMQTEADDFYGRTFPKRIERISQGLGMINMMLELVKMSD